MTMLKLGKRSTFLPVSREQYFSQKNQEEVNRSVWVTPTPPKNLGEPFGNNLICRSDSQSSVTWVRRSIDIRKNTQVTTEEFFDASTNYDYTENYPHFDFSQSRTSYFLRTDGVKYMDNVILLPFRADGNVSIVQQVKFVPPVMVSIEDVFNELYIQWREQTKFNSFIGNSTDIYHEKIVKLGYGAVPLIINKLRTEHAHLFIALSRITSKLGEEFDIEHDSPEVLNGPAYGTAKIFMKRKTDS